MHSIYLLVELWGSYHNAGQEMLGHESILSTEIFTHIDTAT